MQNLLCPFKKLKVTQFDNGQLSHQGSDAWDITDGIVGSKAPYFAPCDVVCKQVDKQFAFTWWQSLEKVKFADGTEDYATFMFGHDNTINCFVGQRIKQGIQLGNMGTGGNATGVHCHIEVAKGKYQGKWYRNPQGVYCLHNSIKFYDAFFMDGVEILKNYRNDQKSQQEQMERTIPMFRYLQKPIEKPSDDKQVIGLTNQLVQANKQIEKLEIENLKYEEELKNANEKLAQIKAILK